MCAMIPVTFDIKYSQVCYLSADFATAFACTVGKDPI
jgi:hypothetical protein